MGRRRRWFLLAGAVVLLAGCGGEYRWSKSFGGGSFVDTIRVGDVAVAPDGAAIVVGRFEGRVDIGGTSLTANGKADIFVARYRANGDVDWVQKFGGSVSDSDYANAVVFDADGNAYVGGEFRNTATFGTVTLTSASPNSDGFVAKVTPTGTVAWARAIGGTGIGTDTVSALATNGTRVAATGQWTDAKGDVLLAAMNTSNGADVFAPRHEGGSEDDYGNGIAIDAAGTITVTGFFKERANLAGQRLTSAGFDDTFLARYGAGGNGLTAKRFGSTGLDRPASLASAGDELVLAGNFAGTVDFGGKSVTALGPGDMFVTRFGANLAPIWAQRYGGNTGSAETLHDVAVDTKGNAVATGEVIASVDFGTGALNPVGTGQDPFLVKIDPTGKTVWAKRFTTTSQATNVGAAVATAPDNDVVAAGAFMADITIGGTTPHTSVGGNGFTQSPDGYIARFAP